MAQFKVYLISGKTEEYKKKLSDTIHICAQEYLGLPPEKKFHRFISLNASDFIYPDDRTEDYIIIEVHMFSGRTIETRKALLKGLMLKISQNLDIKENDIEITLIESPPENWGIRGKTGDELILNYKVNK